MRNPLSPDSDTLTPHTQQQNQLNLVNGQYRYSTASTATNSTVNTRTSSILPSALPNLGKTASVVEGFTPEETHEAYLETDTGKNNKERLDNVPMGEGDANKFNKNVRINQLSKLEDIFENKEVKVETNLFNFYYFFVLWYWRIWFIRLNELSRSLFRVFKFK